MLAMGVSHFPLYSPKPLCIFLSYETEIILYYKYNIQRFSHGAKLCLYNNMWQASKVAQNRLGEMVIYPFRFFFPKSLGPCVRGHSDISTSQKGPCFILIPFLLQLCASQHYIYHFRCVCILCCTNESMFLAVAGFNSYFRSCGDTQNKQNATQKRRNLCQTQFYKLLSNSSKYHFIQSFSGYVVS